MATNKQPRYLVYRNGQHIKTISYHLGWLDISSLVLKTGEEFVVAEERVLITIREEGSGRIIFSLLMTAFHPLSLAEKLYSDTKPSA